MARANFNSRREAIARARGFPVPYEDARGRVRVPRSAYYQYRTTVAGWTAPNSRRTLRNGDEITHTRDEGTLAAAMRRAAGNGATLFARVTMLLDPEDGSHPKTWPRHNVELWERGGWAAENAVADLDDYGIAFALIKAQVDEIEKYPGVVIDVLLRAVQ